MGIQHSRGKPRLLTVARASSPHPPRRTRYRLSSAGWNPGTPASSLTSCARYLRDQPPSDAPIDVKWFFGLRFLGFA